MILKSWFGTLAESTPFTDRPLGLHWYGRDLYDDEYRVGRIDVAFAQWHACPYWNEEDKEFDTEEEARAWLVAMYKMGGQNEPRKHRRPAAK